MRYLSLFSGIEACTVAWKPLGWECVAVAEIEPWPSRALAHHYPDVPNLGDVTKVTEEQIAALGRIDVVVFGSPCFTAGHTVLTERGLVPIENVVVGDMVWTHASRWRRVSNTMQRVAPTVVVNGQGHNSIRATPDHPFYAADTVKIWNGNGYSRTVGAAEWVHAEKMAGKRWATPHNLSSDQGVPDVLNTLDGAYLAGLYLGDGHIVRTAGRKKKSVILSVNDTKKAKILPALRRAWGTISDISHDRSVTRLQLSRTEVADTLAENFKEYSHGKTIPVWALTADRDWQESLLQGVIDTDGSPVKNGWRVTTVSRTLAVGLRLLATRLGYSTSLHFSARPETCVIEGRTVNQRDTWTVFMRKAERSSELRTDEHTWGLVRSATPAGDAQVYDITVEDDHSFICDGIVVHNCQDLSVAGKRKGLDGARSGLFFTAMQIVGWARQWCDCRFALWENVPGAFSSNGGRDFAAVVDAMAGLEGTGVPPKGWGSEGCAIGAEAMVEWSTLDAQWFGVAQRRRRVFAIADFGDWRNRPPILLEPEGLRGDSAPRRETGEDVTGTLASRTRGGGFPGSDEACSGYVQPVTPTLDQRAGRSGANSFATSGGLIPVGLQRPILKDVVCMATGQAGDEKLADLSPTLNCNHEQPIVSYSKVETPCEFCGYEFDQTSVGRYGCPNCEGEGLGAEPEILAFNSNAQPDEMKFDEHVSAPLTCSQYSAVAIGCDTYNGSLTGDVAATLGTQSGDGLSSGPSVLQPGAVAFQSSQSGVRLSDVHATLDSNNGPRRHNGALVGMRVRRLLPTECEALQGFPRGYTAVPDARGKPSADGPRYKALGNSMAVPVMRWIGQQIDYAMLW